MLSIDCNFFISLCDLARSELFAYVCEQAHGITVEAAINNNCENSIIKKRLCIVCGTAAAVCRNKFRCYTIVVSKKLYMYEEKIII